jgi:hypothetical protein
MEMETTKEVMAPTLFLLGVFSTGTASRAMTNG